MERLTEKVNDYWKTNDKAHIYYLDKNESVFIGNAIDRLAEFEDFMEEMDFDSLEHLAFTLEEQNKIIEAYEQENQALKDFNSRLQNINIELLNQKQILLDRWQKLKKLLEKDMEHNSKEYDESFCSAFQHYSATENWVLDRMAELEKE